MKYTTILYGKSEGIGVITLNRPESMNSFNSTLMGELGHLFGEILEDSDVKVVIITGQEQFFAAGADITEVLSIVTPVDAYNFQKQQMSSANWMILISQLLPP